MHIIRRKSISQWMNEFLFNFHPYFNDNTSLQSAQYPSAFLSGTILLFFILTFINLINFLHPPFGEPFLIYIVANILGIVIYSGLWYANKKGHIRWAPYLFLILIIASFTLGFTESAFELVNILYILPVIAASFVLSPIASILFAVICAACYSIAHLFSPDYHTYNSIFIITTFAAAVMTFMIAHRSKKAFQKSNVRLKQNKVLVENAPGVIYIINLRPKFSWAYISPQILPLLGYSCEEWLKSNSMWKKNIHPEDLSHVKVLENQAKRKKKAVSCEYRIKRKDGEYIWVKDNSYFIRSNSGVDQMYGLMIDITPLKIYQEALKESEDRNRTIVNGVRDAIFVENSDGMILDVNDRACAMYEWSRQEFIGKKISEIVPAQNKELSAKELLSEAGSEKLVETIHRKKNGELFPVELSAHIEKLGDRDVMLIIARDITERKQTEERIQQSLKEKNVLFQELHHRVKNNLQVISSLLSVQSKTVADPIVKDSFRIAQSRIRAIASIHEGLYRSPDVSQIHMQSYINQLTNNLASLYDVRSGIHLTLDVDDITLDLDNAMTCGLIVNELVTNAFKYAFNGNRKGKIKVSLRTYIHSTSQYNLTVEDNGVGVSDQKLFETNKGLGIQLVKTLSSQLNGHATMTSQKGTKVSVDFSPRTANTN